MVLIMLLMVMMLIIIIIIIIMASEICAMLKQNAARDPDSNIIYWSTSKVTIPKSKKT